MNVDDLKKNLLGAPCPLVERVTVESAAGPVELLIRKPPDKVVAEILASADRDGIREGNESAVSPEAALRFRARVVAATVYAPNAVRPLFTEEEVWEWPLTSVVAEACQRAIIPSSVAVERAKGN